LSSPVKLKDEYLILATNLKPENAFRKRMHSANNYLSPVEFEEKMLQNEMSD
jgi:hypothetical protein